MSERSEAAHPLYTELRISDIWRKALGDVLAEDDYVTSPVWCPEKAFLLHKSPEWCILPHRKQPGPEHGGWPTDHDCIGFCWIHVETLFAGLRGECIQERQDVDIRYWPDRMFTQEVMKKLAEREDKPFVDQNTLAYRNMKPPPTPRKQRRLERRAGLNLNQ